MANNYDNFGFNQNELFTSGFLGFQEGSSDHTITPYPIVPQNNESQNTFFMSDSPKNHGIQVRFGDLTFTTFHEGQNQSFMRGSPEILTGFEDLATIHPTVQQNTVQMNNNHISHASFTFNCPPSGQNNACFMMGHTGICGGTNHIGSSFNGLNNHRNTAKTSRSFSRSTNKVNRSPSSKQCNKRVRFRRTFLSGFKICVKIQALIPYKSIRDIAMRIQWLMKQGKLDNFWDRKETLSEGDWSDLKFYMPDNPNDPDLLAIRNMVSAA
ncbi:hypothetical protein POM88_046338 [Heracleum sosnowskyi]|uniref:Uncharacterized protein n=1 Tax=Heracleum sosnowskyi TaxID=360622 RepID=A0AAD8M6V6_9APIA|nr:hypothetical protein POM88_046338 [Heracleum sosnowskyi]